MRWYERGLAAQRLVPADAKTATQPTEDDFADWIMALVENFKFVIEQTDDWKLLWNDGLTTYRPEKMA